ncbi:HepT-like ribonuclease domain-containing protein, partial [uncultured Duncaniella sp.]
LRCAVLLNIAIIGEAVNQILKIEPEIGISSSRQIVCTRNYIIHGYDSLDNEILWSIVINHLPLLKMEIENLLTVYKS